MASSKKKAVKINIPSKDDKALSWTRHVYDIIKETNPNLIKQENIIEAYNAFVEITHKNKDALKLITYKPDFRTKYNKGIVIGFTKDGQITGINYYPTYPINKKDCPHFKEIIDTYYVLFELIKTEVVPYMERKHAEYMHKVNINDYTKQLKRQEQALLNLSSRFDANIQYYERSIHSLSIQYEQDHKRHTKYIEDLRAKLEDLGGDLSANE